MQTCTAEEWADRLRDASHRHEVDAIFATISEMPDEMANSASIVVACAMMIGQSIADGGPHLAAGIRAGSIALIDAFAAQQAMGVEDA